MVVFGAGSAGLGIADQVRDAIATEGDISHEEASKQIWYVFLMMLYFYFDDAVPFLMICFTLPLIILSSHFEG